MRKHPGQEYWGSAWRIQLDDGTCVGDLYFKGAPDEDGSVEIGYGIYEDNQRNGYATEMVGGMVHWALCQPKVTTVVAEAEESNVASQKVLMGNGFQKTGMGIEGIRFALFY